MPADLFRYLDWIQAHQWVFWLLVNLSAYLTYRICTHAMVGIFGIVIPLASGACTIIFASEWWMGGIGVATILVVSAPFFVIARKDRKRGSKRTSS